MNESFIGNRITELRMALGKSEREMSLDLGHSVSYINGITSGRISPSMKEFFYICEYLRTDPKHFFDTDSALPAKKKEALELIESAADEDMELIIMLLKRLS